MKRNWFEGEPKLDFEIPLEGEVHRITWDRGRLRLHDHDTAAERVLMALGGEPCPCLLILQALKDHDTSDESRGWVRPRPKPRTLPRMLQRVGNSVARAVGGIPAWTGHQSITPPMSVHQTLEQLKRDPNFVKMHPHARAQILGGLRREMALELLLPHMLELMDQMAGVRRVRESRQRRMSRPPRLVNDVDHRLQNAAAGAFEEAMRRSRRDLRPYATITVEVWKQKDKDDPVVKGSLDSQGGFAAVCLPICWLNRVWIRGLSLLDGFFVTDVDASAPTNLLLGQAVRWERQPGGGSLPMVADCSISRNGGTWELRW